MPPKLSLVVGLYNQLDATRAMLDSLRATLPAGLAYEVIFIDDGSTDDTRAGLATLTDSNIRVLLNPRNLGYAATNNRGVAIARGELLALLNNDLILTPGWLAPMLATLERPSARAALVGNVQLRPEDGQIDHAGITLTPRGQFAHLQTLLDSAPAAWPVHWVTGACVLLRRADFQQVGGFDDGYVNGGEDLDLCFKLTEHGQRIWLAGASRIRHRVSLSRAQHGARDLANSRRLFGRWRPVIKRHLADVWRTLLDQGPAAYRPYLSGQFAPDLLASPHVASRILAESFLRVEEAQWQRTLDGHNPHEGLTATEQPADRNCLTLHLPRLCGAQHLHLHGRWPEGATAEDRLEIDLRVNQLQQRRWSLNPSAPIRLRLRHPLALAGIPNRLSIRIRLHSDRPRPWAARQCLERVLVDDHGLWPAA